MKIIFSKRQIELLKEDTENKGLNVMLPSSGDTSDVLNKISQLPKGSVNKATIPTSGATKNPQNNNYSLEMEQPESSASEISKTIVGDLAKKANQIGVKGEIDFINTESVVRYTKKELNEILFR